MKLFRRKPLAVAGELSPAEPELSHLFRIDFDWNTGVMVGSDQRGHLERPDVIALLGVAHAVLKGILNEELSDHGTR